MKPGESARLRFKTFDRKGLGKSMNCFSTGSGAEYGREAIEGCIRAKMKDKAKKLCLHFSDCLDSTNQEVRRLAGQGAPEGCIVVADAQTAGRGRRGRDWESPAGKNLYFSLLLRPTFSPQKAAMLTLVMAQAVVKGLCLTGKTALVSGKGGQPEIKWPNDIVVNGKKVCGILTELQLGGLSGAESRTDYVIIGVGINVGLQEFVPELCGKAACLKKEWGVDIAREELLAEILSAFFEEYEQFLSVLDLSFMKERYNSRLVNHNREVCVLEPKGNYRGTARGINEKGELLVERENGTVEAVYAGEVSVRGIYGYV